MLFYRIEPGSFTVIVRTDDSPIPRDFKPFWIPTSVGNQCVHLYASLSNHRYGPDIGLVCGGSLACLKSISI
jgi:hypothetical protein